MRLARARVDGVIHLVRVEGDEVVVLATESRHVAADVLREALSDGIDFAAHGERRRLADVVLLRPVARPSKVVAIGLNYLDHAEETGAELPTSPLLFAKLPNTLCDPGDVVSWNPTLTSQVDYEAELAVVIGCRAKAVRQHDALDYVLGYTILNDLSARDLQMKDGQWIRGKSLDGFAPAGPLITTVDELGDGAGLGIRCVVDGVLVQDSSTDQMIFGVAAIVAHVSAAITLEPGDVIATGTPAGVGFTRTPPLFLQHGSVVRVEIDGIGWIENRVNLE